MTRHTRRVDKKAQAAAADMVAGTTRRWSTSTDAHTPTPRNVPRDMGEQYTARSGTHVPTLPDSTTITTRTSVANGRSTDSLVDTLTANGSPIDVRTGTVIGGDTATDSPCRMKTVIRLSATITSVDSFVTSTSTDSGETVPSITNSTTGTGNTTRSVANGSTNDDTKAGRHTSTRDDRGTMVDRHTLNSPGRDTAVGGASNEVASVRIGTPMDSGALTGFAATTSTDNGLTDHTVATKSTGTGISAQSLTNTNTDSVAVAGNHAATNSSADAGCPAGTDSRRDTNPGSCANITATPTTDSDASDSNVTNVRIFSTTDSHAANGRDTSTSSHCGSVPGKQTNPNGGAVAGCHADSSTGRGTMPDRYTNTSTITATDGEAPASNIAQFRTITVTEGANHGRDASTSTAGGTTVGDSVSTRRDPTADRRSLIGIRDGTTVGSIAMDSNTTITESVSAVHSAAIVHTNTKTDSGTSADRLVVHANVMSIASATTVTAVLVHSHAASAAARRGHLPVRRLLGVRRARRRP